MSISTSARRWYLVHKWSSLVCTIFLLLLCLTGLPLIFNQEIGDWLDDDPPYATMPANTPAINLDRLVEASRKLYPEHIVISVYIDDDEPKVLVSMAPSWAKSEQDPNTNHWLKFDSRSGALLQQSGPPSEQKMTLMDILVGLHIHLFAGFPGQMLLALLGVLFLAALVSGVVLYGPFMKKLAFGSVRSERTRRLKWLDLHNLLGIVTLTWALVVGFTGVLNELSSPLMYIWKQTDVNAMLAPWLGQPPPAAAALSSLQAAVDISRRATPGMTVFSITYPGGKRGSPYHYMIWTKGGSALTSRLFSPVLVDARNGALSAVVNMPWYLRALELSRPLHYGDYGGLPLKLLWSALDLMTLAVLGSGLYLWFARRKNEQGRLQRLAHAGPVRENA